jgi:hypothetical protein
MVHDDNNLPQPIIQTLENSRTLEYEHPSRHRYLIFCFAFSYFFIFELRSILKGSESAKYNVTNLDSRFYIVYFNDLI